MEDDRLFLVTAVCLLIVVLIFIYALALGRTPTEFTEVWLVADTQNISEVSANQNFEVGFVISNSQTETVNYSYKISAENQIKKQGSIEVAAGEEKTVNEAVSLSSTSSEKKKVLIEVFQPEKEEPFTLWLWVRVVE